MSKNLSIEEFLKQAEVLREEHEELINYFSMEERPFTIPTLTQHLENQGYDIEEYESAIISFEQEYAKMYERYGFNIDMSRENENLNVTNYFCNF